MVVIVRIPGVPVVIKAGPAAPGCPAQARVDLMGPLARQHATCTTMPVLQFPISLYVCRSNAPHKPGGCLLVQIKEWGQHTDQRVVKADLKRWAQTRRGHHWEAGWASALGATRACWACRAQRGRSPADFSGRGWSAHAASADRGVLAEAMLLMGPGCS